MFDLDLLQALTKDLIARLESSDPEVKYAAVVLHGQCARTGYFALALIQTHEMGRFCHDAVMARACLCHGDEKLNDWERNFLSNIKSAYTISPKRKESLDTIVRKLGVDRRQRV